MPSTTQGPSELTGTALSQCGTIIALRLTSSYASATEIEDGNTPVADEWFGKTFPSLGRQRHVHSRDSTTISRGRWTSSSLSGPLFGPKLSSRNCGVGGRRPI